MKRVAVPFLLALLTNHANAFESSDCLILPSQEVELGAAVPGLLAEVLVDRGDRVEAGRVVARLRSDVQEAMLAVAKARADSEARVKAAETRLQFEKQELARAEDLFKRRVIPRQEVDERRTAHQVRLRELEEAQSDAQLSKMDVLRAEAEMEVRRIRSPIAGVVTERSRDPGEYLRDDGSVLKIAQLDILNVEVFLPQAMYLKVNVDDLVQVRSDLGDSGQHTATVTVVDPVIDAASATFGVRLELSNEANAFVAGTRCIAEF